MARVKRDIIRCPKHRTKKVCDGNTKCQEIKHLRQVFRDNGYPEAVVEGLLPNQPGTPKLLLILYIPGLSERFERVCNQWE